jgi:hypothetical protein
MVCTTRRSLRGGSELTYNYDAHQRSNAYTVSSDDAAVLTLLGHTFFPCRCAAPAPCPRSRFFPC